MNENPASVLELGPLDLVAVGQGRCFVANGRQIAIFRLRDGSVFAIDNLCPHSGGPLSEGVAGIDYSSQTESVVCPFHSYKFSLRDGRGLDTELQVRSYPVEVRAGRIFISIA